LNNFPALDVLSSVSRLMLEIVSPQQWQAAQKIRSLMATYKEAEDLINIGAYASGSNPAIDEAVSRINQVREFLQQQVYEQSSMEQTITRLNALTG